MPQFGTDRDKTDKDDKFVTDGLNWFNHSADRGFSKGSKDPNDGKWEFQLLKNNLKFFELTLFCMNDKLMARHSGAPD